MKKKFIAIIAISLMLISMTVSAKTCKNWEPFMAGAGLYCRNMICGQENEAHCKKQYLRRECTYDDGSTKWEVKHRYLVLECGC